jgi:hypothetical protein
VLVGGQGNQPEVAGQVAAFLNIPFKDSASGATVFTPQQIIK